MAEPKSMIKVQAEQTDPVGGNKVSFVVRAKPENPHKDELQVLANGQPQPANIPPATGGTVIDVEARAALASVIAVLELYGLSGRIIV